MRAVTQSTVLAVLARKPMSLLQTALALDGTPAQTGRTIEALRLRALIQFNDGRYELTEAGRKKALR